jgi:DNA repair exonuclease SbcCD ATPase subunit
MSVGNVTQTLHFDKYDLTLILGENADIEGDGNRNGVGKSTILNALSFVLFDQPLLQIKKDNLINDINQKEMMVTVEYDVDSISYRIERGRKPNILKFYVNDRLDDAPPSDETMGKNISTQVEIERSLSNLSHLLFKYIFALHPKITPFLSLREKDQREIIEELLSITQLSAKADRLKEQAKSIRDEIKSEEVRIRTLIESNERIQYHINDLKFKSTAWDKAQSNKIAGLRTSLNQYTHIDVDAEIQAQKQLSSWRTANQEFNVVQSSFKQAETSYKRLLNELGQRESYSRQLAERLCPTCHQALHDTQSEQMQAEVATQIELLSGRISEAENQLLEVGQALEDVSTTLENSEKPGTCSYPDLESALNHRALIVKIQENLHRESQTENPFLEQIANLTTSAIQDVSYDYLNELSRLRDHQDFLYKLLTSKESFIRKRIIDQNLRYLNENLNSYLRRLLLPHEVSFKSDLSVDIEKLGKEYDYDQLSSGQSNRLVLALSWAFRDVWEAMNGHVNLLIVDELIDSNMDDSGTEAGIEVLRTMSADKRMNIFLISHREYVRNKVDSVLMVQMQDSFTSFIDSDL